MQAPRAVGTHIFAGSFTIGMMEHFEVLCHLESSNYGVETFNKNYPDIPVYSEVSDWPLEVLSEMDVDLVYGNPPCAPWARQGLNNSLQTGRDWRDDDRLDCIHHHVEALRVIEPKFWVWESVTRAFTAGRELVQMIEDMVLEAGYSVTHFIHEANFLGSCQKRPRYMMIVHDRPINWEWPSFERTLLKDVWHKVENVKFKGVEARPTNDEIWERWQRLMPKLKPDQKLRELWIEHHPDTKRGRPYNMVRRIDLNQPTKTLVGGVTWIHPTEDRFLDTNEMAVLMGYPDGYQWSSDKPIPITCQISRGVCIEVADYIGRVLADSLDNEPFDEPQVEIVDFKKKPGSREIIR
ncbi:MAG: DNA cytosine methyltransferase [Phycisphaerales bacterium JB052]